MICKIWDKVKIGPPLRGYFSILIWSLELFSEEVPELLGKLWRGVLQRHIIFGGYHGIWASSP
jgi:hypothetical protein